MSECTHTLSLYRGDWGCHVTTASSMRGGGGGGGGGGGCWVLRNELCVWEHTGGGCACRERGADVIDMRRELGEPLFARVWERSVPRAMC